MALDRRKQVCAFSSAHEASSWTPQHSSWTPQHSGQVLSLCILIDSIIRWGPRFILGQNWLSKLPLFFSKTKTMLIGSGEEDDILDPKLRIYIKYPQCQMGEKTR